MEQEHDFDQLLKGTNDQFFTYQLYKDNTETTYCSHVKIPKKHGEMWIDMCLRAHKGTQCVTSWQSDTRSGTIWQW